jgi:hypothetical protein
VARDFKKFSGNDSDERAELDPMVGCCAWHSSSGRCHYAGVMAHSTQGEGKFYCALHFRNADPITGDEIVRRSHFDVPNPDYSLESRIRMSHQAFLRERGHAIKGDGKPGVTPKEMQRKYVATIKRMTEPDHSPYFDSVMD